MTARKLIYIFAALAALPPLARPAAAQLMYYNNDTANIYASHPIQSTGNLYSGSGIIYMGNATRRWEASSQWNTFYTDYGYIQLGPANAGWAHIYSSLNFYFDYHPYVKGVPMVTNNGGTWNINITGSAATATSATNSDTVDGLHAASFSRTDYSPTWVRGYYEYGANYLTTELPNDILVTQTGGGGVRVDFMNNAGGAYWNHVLSFSGHQAYGAYQLGGYYSSAAQLYIRKESRVTGNTWTPWRPLLSKFVDMLSCQGDGANCTPPPCAGDQADLGVSCGTYNYCTRRCCAGWD